jgi:hypothetical protein
MIGILTYKIKKTLNLPRGDFPPHPEEIFPCQLYRVRYIFNRNLKDKNVKKRRFFPEEKLPSYDRGNIPLIIITLIKT